MCTHDAATAPTFVLASHPPPRPSTTTSRLTVTVTRAVRSWTTSTAVQPDLRLEPLHSGFSLILRVTPSGPTSGQTVTWAAYSMTATGSGTLSWFKVPSTPFDDSAPSASLDCLKARAAPTYPRAQPRHLGCLPWPQVRASGRPKIEDVPLSTTRTRTALSSAYTARRARDLTPLKAAAHSRGLVRCSGHRRSYGPYNGTTVSVSLAFPPPDESGAEKLIELCDHPQARALSCAHHTTAWPHTTRRAPLGRR